MLLGKKTTYPQTYDKSVLCAVKRIEKRKTINYSDELFDGIDIWTCYEVSCLNAMKKPENYIGYMSYSSKSKYIIESKSLKLYLNSFNMTCIDNISNLKKIVETDLSEVLQTSVDFQVYKLNTYNRKFPIVELTSECIDDIITTDFEYNVNKKLLLVDNKNTQLFCHSNLLRSNCLVTGQPDWGTIEVYIEGEVPTKESLLKYLISFRSHQEFHEQCIERIITTLKDTFNIDKCYIKGNYVRRGGIDINPIRCYNMNIPEWNRLVRQ